MSLSVEKCIEGWTNSLRQLKVKADIVFFGDSLTYYGDFASVFPDKAVCNLGLRGDNIQGLINRVEQVQLLEPQQVFIMAGINDVASCTKEEFKSQYEALLKCLKKKLPGVEIVIQNLLPVNNIDFIISCCCEQIKAYNEIIAELAKRNNIKLLDLYSIYQDNSILPSNITKDGIHLKDNQYGAWYSMIV